MAVVCGKLVHACVHLISQQTAAYPIKQHESTSKPDSQHKQHTRYHRYKNDTGLGLMRTCPEPSNPAFQRGKCSEILLGLDRRG